MSIKLDPGEFIVLICMVLISLNELRVFLCEFNVYTTLYIHIYYNTEVQLKD